MRVARKSKVSESDTEKGERKCIVQKWMESLYGRCIESRW